MRVETTIEAFLISDYHHKPSSCWRKKFVSVSLGSEKLRVRKSTSASSGKLFSPTQTWSHLRTLWQPTRREGRCGPWWTTFSAERSRFVSRATFPKLRYLLTNCCYQVAFKVAKSKKPHTVLLQKSLLSWQAPLYCRYLAFKPIK